MRFHFLMVIYSIPRQSSRSRSVRTLEEGDPDEQMSYFRPAALLVMATVLFSCCGEDPARRGTAEKQVSIYAGKGVTVGMTLPEGEFQDSLMYRDGAPFELYLHSEELVLSMTAMTVPGCGSTPSNRLAYLEGGEADNLDTVTVAPRGEVPPFTAVTYVKGDSSFVERVWNRGNSELVVLRVSSISTSMSLLLASVSGILTTAELSGPGKGLERSVYLSDRTRSEIVREVNADVTVPPDISHRMRMQINPAEKEMNVLDTLNIDFRTTQSDSQLTLYFPRSENGTGFEPLAGSISIMGDSVICTAGPTRQFTGVYSAGWNGFLSSNSDRMTTDGMRIDRSISFQCGMWFYPGCDIPSSYSLRVSLPEQQGYRIYVPLDETGRSVTDSILTVSYSSPSGGVKGPLAWAAGGFTQHYIAAGRSLFIHSGTDPAEPSLVNLADRIAGVLWSDLGYDGARLDMIIVNVLDLPVLMAGPGCVFLSGEMLEEVSNCGSWTDSLASGAEVRATSIVFETARSFLAGSTYLSNSLRDVLAGWAVCRFIVSEDPGSAPRLMEALMKHYLYSTEVLGPVEYSIADPMLETSPLYEPVIMGKAPVVMEFLTGEIPAFERALPRALGNLRHSGDSFSRLFSAMGIMEASSYGEMFFQWFYGPGVPLLEVAWSDTGDVLTVMLQQYQPGQDFPLGSITDRITVITEVGSHSLQMSRGFTAGSFTADLSGIPEMIIAVDIDPLRKLPADIVYRHGGGDRPGI